MIEDTASVNRAVDNILYRVFVKDLSFIVIIITAKVVRIGSMASGIPCAPIGLQDPRLQVAINTRLRNQVPNQINAFQCDIPQMPRIIAPNRLFQGSLINALPGAKLATISSGRAKADALCL
jgi:hypothetical protein